MSQNDSSYTDTVDVTKQMNNESKKEYEAIVQRLAFAAINEQRRSRRWRIFFILLTFIYLTPLLLLTVDLNGFDFLQTQKEGSGKHTALVKMPGIIASGEKASAKNIMTGLQDAFDDEDTAGVILEINSPGGSPVQSADIYNEILRLRKEHEEIPLYVVVSDMAASGGYFVAAAADKIYVNKSSLVGSIGVRMDSFGLVDLIEKMGIERRLLTAGEHKGLLDPFLPSNEKQQQHLQTMLDQVHQHFITAVKEGRGERLKDNPDLFSGLIWSGEEAINLGLVDEYGSTEYVARDVIEEEDIVDFTTKELLFDRLADRVGAAFGHIFTTQFQTNLNIM
ncbi:MAG: signal peptide peptidase SppA [Gammaproteobacteria bacterium]|nr:signal peptide peptidase SppA [Gammaproteobacteria bacterium]